MNIEKRNQPGLHEDITTWLDYLCALHPLHEVELGLTRIRTVAAKIGLCSHTLPFIVTVGGTNGKGSTCCILEQILSESGYKVGLYTSPHIEKFNERIRVERACVADAALKKALAQVLSAASSCGVRLTFFEITTLAALVIFQGASLDVVILEVGLGGRLDATNFVDADVSIITSIGLDHTDLLGSTTEDAIGFEKAGIMRKGKPCIFGQVQVPETVRAYVAQHKVPFMVRGEDFDAELSGLAWTYKHGQYRLHDLPYPSLLLDNAVTALAALEHLPFAIPAGAIRRGICQATLTGRQQVLQKAPLIIADVAHNVDAAQKLCASIQTQHQGGLCYAVLGMLADKSIQDVIKVTQPAVDHWLLVNLDSPRAADMCHYQHVVTPQAKVYQSMSHLWRQLESKLTDQDTLVIFGSFYTVAAFKACFQQGALL